MVLLWLWMESHIIYVSTPAWVTFQMKGSPLADRQQLGKTIWISLRHLDLRIRVPMRLTKKLPMYTMPESFHGITRNWCRNFWWPTRRGIQLMDMVIHDQATDLMFESKEEMRSCPRERHHVKSMPKYRGNGCRSAGKRAKVIPRSVLGSRVCAGQRAWLQPGGCALMGCQCPISEGQGWAKAQPGRAGTETKRKSKNRKNTWYYG